MFQSQTQVSKTGPGILSQTLIVTNAPAINLGGVLFPDDSTEISYLHAIASVF